MSTFKTIAKALHFKKMDKVNLTTESVDHRRLTVDEIKEHITEEFEKAKDVKDVAKKTKEMPWEDSEIENEVNWIKALNLKEYFNKYFKPIK